MVHKWLHIGTILDTHIIPTCVIIIIVEITSKTIIAQFLICPKGSLKSCLSHIQLINKITTSLKYLQARTYGEKEDGAGTLAENLLHVWRFEIKE